MQLIALAWGINTIYNQRPLAVVFWEDSFYMVPAIAFSNQHINTDELARFGKGHPVFIYAEKPEITAKLIEMTNITVNTKFSYQQINLYRTLLTNFKTIKIQPIDINNVIENNSAMKADSITILEKQDMDDHVYIPLLSKYNSVV